MSDLTKFNYHQFFSLCSPHKSYIDSDNLWPHLHIRHKAPVHCSNPCSWEYMDCLKQQNSREPLQRTKTKHLKPKNQTFSASCVRHFPLSHVKRLLFFPQTLSELLLPQTYGVITHRTEIRTAFLAGGQKRQTGQTTFVPVGKNSLSGPSDPFAQANCAIPIPWLSENFSGQS